MSINGDGSERGRKRQIIPAVNADTLDDWRNAPNVASSLVR